MSVFIREAPIEENTASGMHPYRGRILRLYEYGTDE